MDGLDLVDLAVRLTEANPPTLVARSRLNVPAMPEPFVSPRLALHPQARSSTPLTSEIILVTSAAAVGKTTAANFLAARGQLPVLNLAEIHVSTDTLAGLLAQDFEDPEAARRAFHAGDLPIIIDALDEGRLRSGDSNFEQFLETTWELLLKDRSVTKRPKLVLLGRGFASELVDLSLQLNADGIQTAWLNLGYFGLDEASRVIESHAAAAARLHNLTWTFSEPARDVIEAFFSAIAKALSLSTESLWTDEQGRALAGYAPVLAAIGSLLAAETNPIHLKNALMEPTGPGRAWDVIERVADEILVREGEEKVRPQLQDALKREISSTAYDPTEQLTYLVQLACGRPVEPTPRVELRGAEAETYRVMVDQQLRDHPFLQDQELKNDVLKSLVLAYGIDNELIDDQDTLVLRQASRQPFLWRSVQSQLPSDEPALLRGEYLGPVLNSLWNDPAEKDAQLRVTDNMRDPGFPALVIRGSTREWRLQTISPLQFYQQLRDCYIDTTAEVKLQGNADGQGVASFDIRGDVTLIARDLLTIEAAAVRIDGSARVYAGSLVQPGQLSVAVGESALWLGGSLEESRPWRNLQPTLGPPAVELEPRGDVERLIEQCSRRIPDGAPIVVLAGSFVPAEHHKLRWLDNYPAGDLFPKILQLMVEHEFARGTAVRTAGSDRMTRLHFNITWRQFLEALRSQGIEDEHLRALVADVRKLSH